MPTPVSASNSKRAVVKVEVAVAPVAKLRRKKVQSRLRAAVHGEVITPARIPFSMARGTLSLGQTPVECHVLNDLRRVLTQREVIRVLSGGRESGHIAPYLERNPLIDKDLVAGAIVPFKIPGQPTEAQGYEATLLIDICTKYLEADDQGLLRSSQKGLAKQAQLVIRACAKVGIIALIDEATGYQEIRAKNALQLKLQAFILEDMQEWAVMFPAEFWRELSRLEGVDYQARHRPLRWGKYIMMFVYDAIDKDVGQALREKNPNPKFLCNHHQWLKQYGRDRVNNQIQRIIAIMQTCNTMAEFRQKFAHIYKQDPHQTAWDDWLRLV